MSNDEYKGDTEQSSSCLRFFECSFIYFRVVYLTYKSEEEAIKAIKRLRSEKIAFGESKVMYRKIGPALVG